MRLGLAGFLGLRIRFPRTAASPNGPIASYRPASIVIIRDRLIRDSDLTVPGRYSASFSSSNSSSRLSRLRLQVRLRLPLALLVSSSNSRGLLVLPASWGFIVSLRSATTIAWVLPSSLSSSSSSSSSSSVVFNVVLFFPEGG